MSFLRSLLASCVLWLLVSFDAPHPVFSFSTPRPHAVSQPLQSSLSLSSSTTSTATAEVANNLEKIHSLNSITSNPHLFPITSDCIHVLSHLQYGDSGTRGPSAEEFLSHLSRELLLLSRNDDSPSIEHTTTAPPEAFTAESTNGHQPFYHVMEVTGPGFTTALGVGVAAQTYDPELYSYYANPMLVAMEDGGVNRYWNGISDWEREPTITAAKSAVIDNLDVVETVASLQKSQGGSNALRDLALSIPVDDNIQQQSHHQLDFSHVASMRDIDYISEQGLDESRIASYDPSLSIQMHDQVGVAFTHDFDGSNYVWDSIGDGQGYYYYQDVSSASSSGRNFVTMDEVGSFDGTVAISGQPDHLPEINYDLSNSLTSDLSDLSYNDLSSAPPTLHHTGELLSDMITSKLDQLGLPHYHLKLPVITNALSDISPSLQNTLLSITKASESSGEKLDGYLNAITHSLDGITGNAVYASSFENLSGQLISKVANLGTSGMDAIENALQIGALNIARIHPPSLDLLTPKLPNAVVHLSTPNMNIIEGISAAKNRFGEASLSDFGNVILHTIKFTGELIINFIDPIINAISGKNIASILVDAQSAVLSLIYTAGHLVLSTLKSIGDMSLIEIIQRLMILVIAITDILLKILNAVIYLASGKDGASWAVLATSSIKEANLHLLAQASSTYNDFTHASLSELARSIGDYGQVVGNEFVTLMGSLDNGIPISDDTFDSVATVLQTGLSL